MSTIVFPRPLLLLGGARTLLRKRKLCPKKLCHLRGSPQGNENNLRTKRPKYHAKCDYKTQVTARRCNTIGFLQKSAGCRFESCPAHQVFSFAVADRLGLRTRGDNIAPTQDGGIALYMFELHARANSSRSNQIHSQLSPCIIEAQIRACFRCNRQHEACGAIRIGQAECWPGIECR